MSIKILFVELPIDWWNKSTRFYIPNPGILAVATYLKYKGYNVKIIDSYAEGIGWNKLIDLIKKERPDIVGASCYTPVLYSRVLLSRLIKKINPSIITILGGTHVTLAPEETLRLARDVDYLVIGEGEDTFLELIRAIENGRHKKDMHSINGIAYLNDGEYIITERRPLIKDLDSLPIPDYSMIPVDRYRNTYFPYSPRQGFSCCFSRGCIEQCTFCSATLLWRGCWRGRGSDNMISELTILNKRYGKRTFLFTDNDFLYDRKRNIEFIKETERSNLKIEFRALTRVDTLLRDKDLLPGLRKIGLTALQIGIENYDQNILDSLQKNYREEQIKEAAFYLKRACIPYVRIFLIIGNYEDSKKSILDIIKKTKRYGFGGIQVSCLVPWPGTEFFSRMKKQGMIKIWDYRRYDWETPIMPTKYLSTREINILNILLFFKWYFDISIFLRNLPNKYLRHYHLYTILSVFFSTLRYKFVYKLKIWKLCRYGCLVDDIYKEHMSFVKNEKH